MRRTSLRILAVGLVALVLLCSISAVRAWSGQARGLIMPGAQQVRIERTGLFQLRATYRLPAEQTVYAALQFLRKQGWRSIRSTVAEPGTFVLVRLDQSGWVRDVMFLTPDGDDRRRVVLQFGRCFRTQWLQCL